MIAVKLRKKRYYYGERASEGQVRGVGRGRTYPRPATLGRPRRPGSTSPADAKISIDFSAYLSKQEKHCIQRWNRCVRFKVQASW